MERLLVMVRQAAEKHDLAAKLRQYQHHLEALVFERTRELEAAKDAAEAGSRAKTDFIMNMSHELRTPLNAIIGFSEVLLDGLNGPLNERQREYAHAILGGGRALRDLILNILEYAETEAGRSRLRLGVFPLRDLLHSVLAAVREEAERRRLAISVELEPGADVNLEADAEKVRRIVGHLLGNAVKFTPEGGSVSVAARRVFSSEFSVLRSENQKKYQELKTQNLKLDADFIEISVADTGIGITPENLPKLFREFTQLEAPATKTFRGAGLGLALVKKLVALHGGGIRVESEFGRGSRFVVLLPLKQSRAVDVSAKCA
jgi:signal transduction histidine kinase